MLHFVYDAYKQDKAMSRPNPAVTLSVRIPPDMRDQLEALAGATGRSKSYLAAEAIEGYLATQAWQVEAIAEAVTEADSPDAKFVDHQDMIDWANERKKRVKKA